MTALVYIQVFLLIGNTVKPIANILMSDMEERSNMGHIVSLGDSIPLGLIGLWRIFIADSRR